VVYLKRKDYHLLIMSYYKYLSEQEDISSSDQSNQSPLSHSYSIYLHLPQDTNWSIESYKLIAQFSTVEEMVETFRQIPKCLIEKGMVFVMKENILPQWEHEDNVKGGSFSYKIAKTSVMETFKHLVYAMTGGNISSNKSFAEDITGVTISPKMGDFCIIKIWTKTTKYQDPTIVNVVGALNPTGCIFKRHTA
jgi:hypothetical protein